MFKIGDKVHHFMELNKCGTIIKILTENNSLLTAGGTTSSKVVMLVEYPDSSIKRINSGDLMKVYD